MSTVTKKDGYLYNTFGPDIQLYNMHIHLMTKI